MYTEQFYHIFYCSVYTYSKKKNRSNTYLERFLYYLIKLSLLASFKNKFLKKSIFFRTAL